MYGAYTVFLEGKSPNIRSYTVHIYGSGQPYVCCVKTNVKKEGDARGGGVEEDEEASAMEHKHTHTHTHTHKCTLMLCCVSADCGRGRRRRR
jgi:hypothetical protein